METRLLIAGEQVAGDGDVISVENPATEETLASVAAPSPEQLDATIAAAEGAAPVWAAIPAVERADLLHEVARRMRDRSDELARVNDELDRCGLRLLRADGPQLRRPRDPLDRIHPAGPGGQGADRRLGLHRALELPAAAARLEARARAGRGEHGRGEALGAHPGLHPDARRLLRAPAARRVQRSGGRGGGRRGDRARPARGRGGLHWLGRDGQARGGSVRGAGCPYEPGDGRQGPVHRLCRRRLRRGGGGQGRSLGCLSERRSGLHLGRALLRGARGLRRLRLRLRRPRTRAARRRPARRRHRRRPDGLRAPAREGEGPGRGCAGGRSLPAHRRRPGRSRARPLLRSRGGHRGAGRDGPAQRGDLRTGGSNRARELARRGHRLANSTRFGLGANVYTRDLETAVRCLREIKAGTVSINDPLTDNDAGPFGGRKQSGLGRELGQEGLEAFQDTKHVHIETKIAPEEWWYPYAPGV